MIGGGSPHREGVFAEAAPSTKGIDFTGLTELAASNVRAAIASGDNFHGYIPSESLEFTIGNYRQLATSKALEAAWLDAYVHASHFKAYGVEKLKAVFDVEFQRAAASAAGQ